MLFILSGYRTQEVIIDIAQRLKHCQNIFNTLQKIDLQKAAEIIRECIRNKINSYSTASSLPKADRNV